jgi:hypothetical protein
VPVAALKSVDMRHDPGLNGTLSRNTKALHLTPSQFALVALKVGCQTLVKSKHSQT